MDPLRGGPQGTVDPSGSLVPARPLLPWEVDLCEAIGLTPEEYLDFDARRANWAPPRPAAYDHIPDVQAPAVVSFIIPIVIGVALSAVAALIAPKPRAPGQADRKRRTDIRTEDVTGQSRFARDSGFSSVQSLAKLGETVPLIFAHRDHIPGLGGVRVESKLLWSQLMSMGAGQQVRLLATFGLGPTPFDFRPGYSGFAIGGQTLKNYTRAKIALYLRTAGGRINEGGKERYKEGTLKRWENGDPFSVFDDQQRRYLRHHCGTRTPETQTQFGLYNAMPNGSMFKVPYELVMVPRGKDVDDRVIEDSKRKKRKIEDSFAHYAAINSAGGRGSSGENEVRVDLQAGDELTYRIKGDTEPDRRYDPWGMADVNASTIDRRIAADDAIRVGDIYMAGEAVVVCESSDEGIWERGRTKTFQFRCLEPGPVELFEPSGTKNPPSGYCLQKVAFATVANNRECDVTEIGIKSTVWRQINGFANVNSHPGGSKVYAYEDVEDGGQLTLGTVTRYQRRISFFRLEFRPLGRAVSDDRWDTLTENLFAIRGNTPVPQYNSFRIDHRRGQYEYRLKPVSGGFVYRKRRGARVWVLDAKAGLQTFNFGGTLVSINAYDVKLDTEELCNRDWLITSGASLTGDNLRPFDVICDYKVYDNERTSAEDGPEHEVVFVNELVKDEPPQYPDLTVMGLRMNSTTEFSQLEQVSAWFSHGLMVERLIGFTQYEPLEPGVVWSTNNLSEIAYNLLTNERWGAGRLIGPQAVNRERCTVAAQFVHANRFTWDGVIDDSVALREWIFEQAGYCLLDFTILGGQFSLYPSVPFRSDFTIDTDWVVRERALFTDGNIRNLRVTWLPPQERQLFRGQALWRQEYPDGFPQVRSISVRLADGQGGRGDDPEEVFDMSGFATSRAHPFTFLRYALRLRQLVDHTVSFETTPHAALNLQPGDIFRLSSQVVHTSRLNNGSIDSEGFITSPTSFPPGTYPILFWRPGTIGTEAAEMIVSEYGRTDQDLLKGTVFSMRLESSVSRFYKVERLSRGEEGFVEIIGSYVPIDGQGRMAVLQWSDNDFIVEDG